LQQHTVYLGQGAANLVEKSAAVFVQKIEQDLERIILQFFYTAKDR
jgi:hypothetical protein